MGNRLRPQMVHLGIVFVNKYIAKSRQRDCPHVFAKLLCAVQLGTLHILKSTNKGGARG